MLELDEGSGTTAAHDAHMPHHTAHIDSGSGMPLAVPRARPESDESESGQPEGHEGPERSGWRRIGVTGKLAACPARASWDHRRLLKSEERDPGPY